MSRLGPQAEAIESAYRSVGVASAPATYVTGNFGRPGMFGLPRQMLLDAHVEALRACTAGDGTVVVPTHSWSLPGTSVPFSPPETPSETGPFTEHLRQRSGTMRQRHPFSSVTALGPRAAHLMAGQTRHAYGPESPWDRLVKEGALFVSVGMPLERSVSLVHHVEFLASVPYRFTKTFTHPVVQPDGTIASEPFFLQVCYRVPGLVRDRNQKIMAEVRRSGAVRRTELGRSLIESVAFGRFVEIVLDLMLRDPYVYLRDPPGELPYPD